MKPAVAVEPQKTVKTIRRDPTKLDDATGKPLCFGAENPDELVCMMCSVSVVCREQRKNGGVPVNVLPDGSFNFDFEDEDDDEGEEEDTD